jgi:dodecin
VAVDIEAEAQKKRWREYEPELTLLLWALWDPISGVPLNEYENYSPAVWKLLNDEVSVERVAGELSRIRIETIGCEPDPEGDERVADRLRAWWYWRFKFPVEFEANS